MYSVLKPLGDRVLVKPDPLDTKTPSGIFLPETSGERQQMGTVIAAGPGKFLEDGRRSPMEAKTGDKVVFGKYTGMEVKIDGEKYIVLKDADLVAIASIEP